MSESIFITQKEIKKTGKITYTNILETIPENHYNEPIKDWRTQYKTEWRWRFLDLPDNRFMVEISFISSDDDNRTFFNKAGECVHRIIDPVYDKFVVKSCYYYI